MRRKSCLSARESEREITEYVTAENSETAMKLAEKLPHRNAFKAISARTAR